MSTTTTTRTMPTPSKPHPSSSSTPATGSISLAASSDSSTDATQWAHPDEIRTRFSKAMSTMYKQEVPLYGDLLKLVKDVNEATMRKDPLLRAQLDKRHELERLDVERHGAIRVGTPQELHMLSRMFKIMGMYPVSYYDLSTSGLPVHATAFRPIAQASLDVNPFRIFTSLLRPELIADPATRELALSTLAKRNIFSPTCVALVEKAESPENNGRLTVNDSILFVESALETFKWHSQSPISKQEYDRLSKAHKLAADICGFQSCHINHLTPRTLDIEAVQRGMAERGIPPKAIIEGPPPMPCPILLRQTSFLALSEPIEFLDPVTGQHVPGHHQARFGEIEQRSLALTKKGRDLYTELLAKATAEQPAELGVSPTHSNALTMNEINEEHLLRFFAPFPQTYDEIRRQELGFFRYTVNPQLSSLPPINEEDSNSTDDLLASKHILFEPLIYEDFLPASAAGIFQSNLSSKGDDGIEGGDGSPPKKQQPPILSVGPDQAAFEKAIGRKVVDEMELYARSQQESLDECARILGIKHKLYP